jgi:trk system potassium uptake protein TrkA
MRIIVIGCGRLGAGLARTLAQRGHAVTVVDSDPAAFARLGPDFGGRTVSGAALDRDALIQAGIERADGLAAVTGSDEVNVVVARMARRVFRAPRAVARLADPLAAAAYQRLGVQTIATTAWGVQRMAELLGYSELEPLLSLGDGEVDIVEVVASPLLAGRTVGDVTIPGEAHVVAITRGGRTLLPAAGAVFQPGDRLHLAVVAASTDRLKALLSPT